MRGNPGELTAERTGPGSIPAHAGKPLITRVRAVQQRVYPRPCGETAIWSTATRCFEGLSPPMRGNREEIPAHGVPSGSIPAHAGKPNRASRSHGECWVYPRPCGETVRERLSRLDEWGLSPPMRGNRPQAVIEHGDAGSIPAHAGKPLLKAVPAKAFRVYPRPCGETSSEIVPSNT